MGQYMTLVNVDAQEFVQPPGPMKPVERLTSPVAPILLNMLVMDPQTPLDGCPGLPDAVPNDHPLVLENKEKILKREAERDTDRRSIYLDSEDNIREEQLTRVAKSHLLIGEAFDHIGTWVGDEVFWVGDYSARDPNPYNQTKPTCKVSIVTGPQEGLVVEKNGTGMPVVEGSWNRSDIIHAHEDKDTTEVGDIIEIKSSYCKDENLEQDAYGRITSIDNEWTNITSGVLSELEMILGDWLRGQFDNRRTTPDFLQTEA